MSSRSQAIGILVRRVSADWMPHLFQALTAFLTFPIIIFVLTAAVSSQSHILTESAFSVCE